MNISPYIEGLKEDEKQYLEEAVKCAQNECKRASIILGWCATIDHLHKKVASSGFDNFNNATKSMAEKKHGRYKRFTKKFKISSMSELREIFDTDLMWVLEFLGYIDNNQHERLRHCFLLRNNCAHPGDAPISGENLYSFYSDITTIVLKNEKFEI